MRMAYTLQPSEHANIQMRRLRDAAVLRERGVSRVWARSGVRPGRARDAYGRGCRHRFETTGEMHELGRAFGLQLVQGSRAAVLPIVLAKRDRAGSRIPTAA